MVLPGHIAGGYLATYALLAAVHSVAPETISAFSQNEILAFYIIGIIAGELPDIDLFWFYLENRRCSEVQPRCKTAPQNHREHITHLPLFWLCISIVICLIGLAFNSAFIYFASFVVLAGILSHFVFDSIEHGICWLRPFSKKRYCLFQAADLGSNDSPRGETSRDQIGGLTYYWRFIVSTYIKSPTFIAEVVVTVVALTVMFYL